MRDLRKHPITKEEMVNCLRQLSEELNKEEKVGDMRPMILARAAEMIEERRVFLGKG